MCLYIFLWPPALFIEVIWPLLFLPFIEFLGETRVLKGLTDTFSYDIPEEALLAAYTKSMIKDSLGEDEFKGVFIADDIVSDERFQKLLRDKKFGTSLYNKLAERQKYYTGLSLRD